MLPVVRATTAAFGCDSICFINAFTPTLSSSTANPTSATNSSAAVSGGDPREAAQQGRNPERARIYNEQITDLLDPNQRNLQIREDVKSSVHVENLTEEHVYSMKDVFRLLIKGSSGGLCTSVILTSCFSPTAILKQKSQILVDLK
ncbi:hypothetical protein RIF29_19832 [Crotalaria pallida]|uniref:Kinesin motor domain-containing protein n=1 Tax=Crotalaria pallida TaxID=3830 RepID=A0AAN9F8I2_CROPI